MTRQRKSTRKTPLPDTPSSLSQVELLETNGHGIGGASWTWHAVLYRRNDGRFTCSLSQVMWLPAKTYRVPGLVGFRKGAALFDYLHSAWAEYSGEHLDEEDWRTVADKVSKLNQKLAGEMRQAIDTEYYPPPSPPPTAADLHARKATWPRERWSGAGGLVPAYQNALRSRAARFYANRYLAEHGRLPTGVHRVEVSVGPANSGADTTPPFGTESSRLTVDITYPEVARDSGS